MDTELQASYLARKAGVNAPNYQGDIIKPGEPIRIKYKLEGDIANTKTNPITPKHIENLLQNFYFLDKAGFYHRNLSSPNIMFSKEGGVEFASMKDMTRFSMEDGKFVCSNNSPDFMMPFETTTLSRYVHNLKDKNAERAFIREYLTQKSEYNEFRAEHLKRNGFKDTDDAVMYETAQALAFKEPSDEVLDYFASKLEISRTKSNATLMWHKAGGLFDGNVNPGERFASVVMLLEDLKNAYELRDRAQMLSQTAETPQEQQYFAFEKEILDLWTKNIYEDAKNGGAENFCNTTFAGNKGLYLGCAEDRILFNEFFDEIKLDDDSLSAQEKIDTVIEYYKNLMADWTPENNRMYKMQYLRDSVPLG